MTHCRHFPACGGCTLLNFNADEQLAIKDAELRKILQPWAESVFPSIPAVQRTAFRSKIQLPFGTSSRGGLLVGCFAANSHEVIDQRECLVQDDDCNRLIISVRAWARYHRLSIYNSTKQTGFLRHLVLRQCAETQEILLGLVTSSHAPAGDTEMAQDLLKWIQQDQALPRRHQLVGILRHINDNPGNFAFGGVERIWHGREFAFFVLDGLRFRVGLSTFFQVHLEQAKTLFEKVFTHIEAQDQVLELYSGTGALSLFLARKAARVLGIEISSSAVHSAQQAAIDNGMDQCQFEVGDAQNAMQRFVEFNTLVVDPPRKGLGAELSHAIADNGPLKFIYLSCNAKTFATDAEILARTYQIKQIQGVDLFPHTEHLELYSVWTRKAELV